MQIFYSAHDDNYRKPMVGMFELMKNVLKPIEVVIIVVMQQVVQKILVVAIYILPNNCLINFKTPEEIFYNTTTDTILKVKNIKKL